MSYQQLGKLLKARCVCKWPWRVDLEYEQGTIEGHSTFQFTFGYAGSGSQMFYNFLRQAGFNVSEDQVFRAQEGDVFSA
jgi:hypothetical protein